MELADTLSTADTQEVLGSLSITESSLPGLSCVSAFLDLEVGQTCRLEFILNDNSDAVIEKALLVRHTHGDGRVGAEFICPEDCDLALEFYLMSLATGN